MDSLNPPLTAPKLLTPGEVAQLFRVDPKTVTRWARDGKLSSMRTPGGHRRYREDEVRDYLEGRGGPKLDTRAVTIEAEPVG